MTYLWIGLGSAFGGIVRHVVTVWCAALWGDRFPVATVLINIAGSFLIGFTAAFGRFEGKIYLSPLTKDFLMIGVLGGFTTFSSFSLQTLYLAQRGEWPLAALNVFGSVALCLAAVCLGSVLGKMLNA